MTVGALPKVMSVTEVTVDARGFHTAYKVAPELAVYEPPALYVTAPVEDVAHPKKS